MSITEGLMTVIGCHNPRPGVDGIGFEPIHIISCPKIRSHLKRKLRTKYYIYLQNDTHLNTTPSTCSSAPRIGYWVCRWACRGSWLPSV